MLTMSILLAIVTIIIEMLIVKRWAWLFNASVRYPLVGIINSLALCGLMAALFGAAGTVVLLASVISVIGSWTIYRVYSMGLHIKDYRRAA